MKKYLSILAFLGFIQFANAQDDGYIGFSLGPSIPLGDFGSSDIDNPKSGFAESGLLLELSIGFKLGEQFGLAGLIRSQGFVFDAQTYVNEFSKIDPTINWYVDADPWSMGAYMFGGYGSFEIAEDLSFDGRALIGIVSASSPAISITAIDDFGDTFDLYQSSADGTSFGFLIGGGLKYNVGQRVCLLFNMDYLTAQPEFTVTVRGPGFFDSDTFSQPMNSFNLGFGIGYRL